MLAEMLGHSLCFCCLTEKGERVCGKAHASGYSQGDCLPVNIMGKTGSSWGKLIDYLCDFIKFSPLKKKHGYCLLDFYSPTSVIC